MNDKTLKRRAAIIEALYRDGIQRIPTLASNCDMQPDEVAADVAALIEAGAVVLNHHGRQEYYLSDATLAAMDSALQTAAECVAGCGSARHSSGRRAPQMVMDRPRLLGHHCRAHAGSGSGKEGSMKYAGIDGAEALLRDIMAALPNEPGMMVGELERQFPGVDLEPALDLLLACAAVGYSRQRFWRRGSMRGGLDREGSMTVAMDKKDRMM